MRLLFSCNFLTTCYSSVASIGSAIGGMFKSRKNKKRDFYDAEEELYMRVFADLQEEMASLERRYDSGSLDELD